MKKLLMLSLLVAASLAAKATNMAYNNMTCDVLVTQICIDPTTCAVTQQQGTTFTIPAASGGVPGAVSLPTPMPCSAGMIVGYQISRPSCGDMVRVSTVDLPPCSLVSIAFYTPCSACDYTGHPRAVYNSSFNDLSVLP